MDQAIIPAKQITSRKRHRETLPIDNGMSSNSSDKLYWNRSSLPPPPPQPTNANQSPSDKTTQSIFTHSFAPMLLYSSVMQDNKTSTLKSRTNTSCALPIATAPKVMDCTTQVLDIGKELTTMNSSAHSSSTSQSSESSQYKNEDLDTDYANAYITDSLSFLPPLPTVVSCPHPAIHPPAPRLPALHSQRSKNTFVGQYNLPNQHQTPSNSYLNNSAVINSYCPSLFAQGLPPLPKESRLKRTAPPYSVNLHGRRMKTDSNKKTSEYSLQSRKQRSRGSYGLQQLPPGHYHQYPYPLRRLESGEGHSGNNICKTSNQWPAAVSGNSTDINSCHQDQQATIARTRPVFHGRKKPQTQLGSNSYQRTYTSRSLGDLRHNPGDFHDMKQLSDVVEQGHQEATETPIGCGISSGGPIRSTRLRSDCRPKRRNTVSSYTSSRQVTISPPAISPPPHNANNPAMKRGRVRTSVACDPCRSFKRKCSGQTPCTLCIHRGRIQDCKFNPGPMSTRTNNLQDSPVTEMEEPLYHAKSVKKIEVPYYQQRRSSKPKESLLERKRNEPSPLLSSKVIASDVEGMDSGSDSDCSSFEFDDESTSAQQSDQYEDQFHKYRQANTYSMDTTVGRSCAPSLPTPYSTSLQVSSFPGKSYMTRNNTQVVTQAYSPPYYLQSPPNAIVQCSMQTSPLEVPGNMINSWTNGQISKEWQVNARVRSNSGSVVPGYQVDNRHAGGSISYHPPAPGAPVHGLVNAVAIHPASYPPPTNSSRENVLDQHYQVPSPPFHHMSQAMQRSYIEPYQTPAVPNAWQEPSSSNVTTISRPFSSSGVLGLDKKNQSQAQDSRKSVIATLLNKKTSEVMPKTDQGPSRSTSSAVFPVVDQAAKASSKTIPAEVPRRDSSQTAIPSSTSGKKKSKQADVASFADLNKLVEAVETIESASKHVMSTRPRRYNTRSQTKT